MTCARSRAPCCISTEPDAPASYLPHDFPPYQTVHWYFSTWTKEAIFTQLGIELTGLARATGGRAPQPSAGAIDTQSVKTSINAPVSTQGIDAGKKIVGRKRGIITDTLGLIIATLVVAAHLSEATIGTGLIDQAKAAHPTLSKLWADTGFKNTAIEHAAARGVNLEIVQRDPASKGFCVLPRRWVVEQTIGWLMLHRRLAREDETLPASSESMIRIAMIDNLLKRITDETTPTWRDT